jgi:hypothetical protein
MNRGGDRPVGTTKTTKRADPLTSEGARLERRVFRAYLRRRLAQVQADGNWFVMTTLEAALRWVQGRQRRYDAKRGGLGRR